jgi:hypothetical protein
MTHRVHRPPTWAMRSLCAPVRGSASTTATETALAPRGQPAGPAIRSGARPFAARHVLPLRARPGRPVATLAATRALAARTGAWPCAPWRCGTACEGCTARPGRRPSHCLRVRARLCVLRCEVPARLPSTGPGAQELRTPARLFAAWRGSAGCRGADGLVGGRLAHLFAVRLTRSQRGALGRPNWPTRSAG